MQNISIASTQPALFNLFFVLWLMQNQKYNAKQNILFDPDLFITVLYLCGYYLDIFYIYI